VRHPGVTFLDHTADVGMDVAAASLDDLLHRAALGMLALLRGEDDEPGRARDPLHAQPAAEDAGSGALAVGVAGASGTSEEEGPAVEAIPISVRVDGPARLLADWLSEILFLHEVRDLDYHAADLDRVEPDHVAGNLLVRPGGHAVREIKGVTYHGLEVRPGEGGGWRARVIFDV
jgi:SHS2 domain-containing protein